MKNKRTALTTVLTLFVGVVLWAGEPWNEKAWSEWGRDDVDRILQDSPWTRSVTVPGAEQGSFPQRGGAGRVADSVPNRAAGNIVYVRWFSATSIRQGFVRGNQLVRTAPEELATKLLEWPADYYVIQIDPYNATGDIFLPAVEDPVGQVSAGAELELSRSKQKLTPVKRETRGFSDVYYFARRVDGKPTIPPEETKVKFSFSVEKSRRSVTFDLSKMMRAGQPDL